MKQYAVIHGDIVDGVTVYGPYNDCEDAIVEWDGDSYILVELHPPIK